MFRRRSAAALVLISLAGAACSTSEASIRVERSAAPTTTTTTAPPSTTEAPPAPTTTTPPVGSTIAAASPAELAARVVTAERIIRDPASSPELVPTAAFELQLLYRQLGREPGWEPEVLAAAPPELQLSIRNNAAARREFRSMHSKLSDTLPAWRIVAPPPAAELLAHYQEAEATFGVPWEILAAVNLVETGLGRIRGTSIAGAQGPMQFMPRTWEAFGAGGDVDDPHDAIMGAARYLAHNGGGRGEIDTALWNYNHSDKYVQGVKYYAEIMAEDPQAFTGFYHWQIVYLSTMGDIWLPTGFEQAERIPVADYVTTSPQHHLGNSTA